LYNPGAANLSTTLGADRHVQNLIFNDNAELEDRGCLGLHVHVYGPRGDQGR